MKDFLFSDASVGIYVNYTSLYSWTCGSNQSFAYSANGGEGHGIFRSFKNNSVGKL